MERLGEEDMEMNRTKEEKKHARRSFERRHGPNFITTGLHSSIPSNNLSSAMETSGFGSSSTPPVRDHLELVC